MKTRILAYFRQFLSVNLKTVSEGKVSIVGELFLKLSYHFSYVTAVLVHAVSMTATLLVPTTKIRIAKCNHSYSFHPFPEMV